MKERFRYLIEGFCRLCGLDNPGRILDGGSVVVDGVVFSLVYGEQINPETAFIYCDYGEVPHGREEDVYRTLLAANLSLHTGSGPAFTVSRETGRVVFADQYRLDGQSSAEGLKETLVRMAARAVEWRAGLLKYDLRPIART